MFADHNAGASMSSAQASRLRTSPEVSEAPMRAECDAKRLHAEGVA
jgi:hypothetical protein